MLNSHANVSTKYARPNNIYSIEIRVRLEAKNNFKLFIGNAGSI
jgi:hypothetical protein